MLHQGDSDERHIHTHGLTRRHYNSYRRIDLMYADTGIDASLFRDDAFCQPLKYVII